MQNESTRLQTTISAPPYYFWLGSDSPYNVWVTSGFGEGCVHELFSSCEYDEAEEAGDYEEVDWMDARDAA